MTGSRLHADELDGETMIGEVRVDKDDYLASAEDEIVVPLPDSLPDDVCAALVSGDLSTFPSLGPAPSLQMTIGSEGPVTVTLARKPNNLAEAAVLMQAGIRRAANGRAAFSGARVGVAGKQLVIVPGGLRAATAFQTAATATDLRLTPARGATSRTGYLSGALADLPLQFPATPTMTASLAGTSHEVALTSSPTDAKHAAESLETALRAAGPQPAFSNARVAALGTQLFVLPGTAGAISFTSTSDDDQTVALLQLRARYSVRVRVHGLENIDRRNVVLPR